MHKKIYPSNTFYFWTRNAMMVLLFAGFSQLVNAQTVSGSFTINSALPTAGTNFQTFTEAVYSLAFGVNGPVVFNVAANSGPYNEQVTISTIAGTSNTNTVTFKCNGVTLQNASVNSLSRAVFKLDGAKHVIIDSLKVLATTDNTGNTFGWGFGLLHDADSNIIRKSTIDIAGRTSLFSQNDIGIYIGSTDDYPSSNGISDCDGNIIDNNTINGGYYGVVLDNYGGNWLLQYSTMNNNKITNNIFKNFYNTGVYIIWNRGTLVKGNDFTGAIPGNASAILLNERNNSVQVIGNRIHDISQLGTTSNYTFAGIDIAYTVADEGAGNTIANNVIYNLTNLGTQTGISINNSTYAEIAHNTIVLNTPGGATSVTTNGLLYGTGNVNVNFRNNIVTLSRTGPGGKYGLNISALGTGSKIDYNDLNVDPANTLARLGSTNYTTLAAWQTASTLDIHSSTQDPVYASPATGDYKPTSPAADNLGTFVGITNDINGDVRNNSHPDAGAYEFLTPPCGNPVNAGAAIVIAASNLCEGQLRTVNLSGNTFGSGQAYQWQVSNTLNGTYTDIGGVSPVPVFDINPGLSMYYRTIVTCTSGKDTSDPVLVTVNKPLAGINYTINAALPTGGTNFASFADALIAFKCGVSGKVVINVTPGSGPYTEQVVIPEIFGTSAANTITINGNGETLQFATTNTAQRAIIKLDGADYITFNNFNINVQGATYGFGIQLLNNADYNTISNCKVNVTTTSTSANYAGIVINSSVSDAIGSSNSQCDNNKITGNTITGGYYGITLYSDPSVEKIFNDTLSYNVVKDVASTGIWVRGTDHAVIEGNDVSWPTRSIAGTIQGIYLNGISTSALVTKNRVHGFGGTTAVATVVNAIYSNNCDASATELNIISNNLMYDFTGTGAQVGLYNSGSDYNVYYHNTISMDNTVGAPTTTARAIYQTTAAVGLEYKDNLVTINRSGTGTNHAIYLNTSTSTFAANNNDYVVAGAGTNRIGFISSTSYSTVAAWATATGKEAQSIGLNPLYANPASGNFTPQNSELDNKGIGVGVTTDITGLPRHASTPDIGAYEFSGTLPVKLLDFSAIRLKEDALVKWVTTSELNVDLFTIERSVNSTDFIEAGTVKAIGNTTSEYKYAFTDFGVAGLATNQVLYYRLKTVDKDGHFTYSTTVAVKFDGKQTVVSIFPNPVVSSLFAKVSTPTGGKVTISVKDIAGRTISTQQQSVGVGTTTININHVQELQKGIYVVTIDLNGNNYNQKVIK